MLGQNGSDVLMVPLDDFTVNVARSGLVPPEVLDHAQSRIEPEPAKDAAVRLARHLIQHGWLTAYQARKLLQGATRGFFLGGYRLLRPLGQGGMGKVYLAVNDKSQQVAVKVLPPQKIREEANILLRFQREMDLSMRCLHPNLAQTIATGNEGDVHFMVMEYIPGKSLYDLVNSDDRGPLSVPDAARLFVKLLDGLEAAHRAGLVHRDIKPSNVMITPEGEVKLLDLGLARALDEEGAITRANVVLGTLDYASPEQLRDAATADQRSDLYSVGCTLYFALSGAPPFEGGDAINKIFKQRMEDPEPIERKARGVPTAFATIVRKLMNKNPAERYQSAAELRADLARWTDPARVRSILGSEAEAARKFRPPPPELTEADLLLLDAEESDTPDAVSVSLRELGSAEPSVAPRHQRPLAPLTAAIRALPRGRQPRRSSGPHSGADDIGWLVHFAIVAVLTGVVAIIAIAIFRHL
jgi:eukaryotic-like serine/threonine-protein kinase